MVQIIERQEDADGADRIEFKVYQSPRDSGRILAQWQYSPGEYVGPIGPMPIWTSKLGTTVDIEFQRVVACANDHGVPFVWLNDPKGLFPPSRRVDCTAGIE